VAREKGDEIVGDVGFWSRLVAPYMGYGSGMSGMTGKSADLWQARGGAVVK
jgi:hypothetical protein